MVGVAIGLHEEVGARLACRVRTVGAQRCGLREESLSAQGAIHLVGRHLVVTLAGLPRGIALRVLARDPRLARRVHEVLRAQDVYAQEELRVFYRTVHVALSREVDHEVDVVVSEEAVHELAVAYVALHEEATLVVDVVLDGAQVAGVSQGVDNDDLNVVVDVFLVQQVLDEVGAYKARGSGDEICFHKSKRVLMNSAINFSVPSSPSKLELTHRS